MNTAQLLSRIEKGAIPPVLLLLGPEAYDRHRIRKALASTVPEEAFTRHDLTSASIAEVTDDARSLSLFAPERVIWVTNGEAALPRRVTDEEADGEGGSGGDAAPLAAYVRNPTPGIVLVFEASRFDFEGDDKRKQDRVRKFYAAIPDVVELRRYSPAEARREAESLVRRAGFRIEPGALDLLVEALGGDIARVATEIEKLAVFAAGRSVTEDDISALVPDARAGNIFALVNALGRRDRSRSLELLDTLVREGEYLPLALAFLSTQFRMALVAREAGLKSSQQIVSHFSRLGIPMWGSRADQVYQTVGKFSKAQLERALHLVHRADRALRDARPDDRVVMEQFILEVVG
jgi:DNA polymerase-3 subunit delta